MLLQDYFGVRPSLELYSIMAAISTSAAVGPGLGGMVRDATGSFIPVFAALALTFGNYVAPDGARAIVAPPCTPSTCTIEASGS